MAAPTTTERVPFDEIIAHPDFAGMTPALKIWVKVYLTTNDAIQATTVAYPRTSAKSRASRACHIQSHPKVQRLLRLAFGEPEPDPLLADLRAAIRKSIRRDHGLSPDTTAALRFYEKMSGKKLKVSNAK